jgi:hypothetical protein
MVVKFMVKVKLMEKSVNSHVGSVIVENVIIEYRTLGIVWNIKVNTHPIHPAMVEGTVWNGGGEKEVEIEVGAVGALRQRDGARPAITRFGSSALSSKQVLKVQTNSYMT